MNILSGLGFPCPVCLMVYLCLSSVPRAKAPARAVRMKTHDECIPWYTTGFE